MCHTESIFARGIEPFLVTQGLLDMTKLDQQDDLELKFRRHEQYNSAELKETWS